MIERCALMCRNKEANRVIIFAVEKIHFCDRPKIFEEEEDTMEL